MCEFASFVLTKDQVFSSRNSSSHEEIIAEHGLHEAGDGGRINIVRVEICPVESWSNLATWKYKVDQDLLPDWYEVLTVEERTRKALDEYLKGAKWLKNLDRFLDSVKAIPWLNPDGKLLKSWNLFTRKTWDAARDAARYASRDAARDAARAAAWNASRDAARDAARAAARDAAGDAARDAAGDAARDAARAAASAAAGDAALYSYLILAGNNLAIEHRKHITARWRVWQKGYALLCDVNGVLYVYAKE